MCLGVGFFAYRSYIFKRFQEWQASCESLSLLLTMQQTNKKILYKNKYLMIKINKRLRVPVLSKKNDSNEIKSLKEVTRVDEA